MYKDKRVKEGKREGGSGASQIGRVVGKHRGNAVGASRGSLAAGKGADAEARW